MSHNKNKKSKIARIKESPPSDFKKPRIPLESEKWGEKLFRWRVNDNYVDMDDEEWGWGRVTINEFFLILKSALQKYEEMTWNDVLKRKSCHPLPIHEACPKAKRRFLEICPDVDTLHQVDYSELGRIWGVKKGEYLHIVWCDNEHTVCPLKKR
jgi:hypothetical protein